MWTIIITSSNISLSTRLYLHTAQCEAMPDPRQASQARSTWPCRADENRKGARRGFAQFACSADVTMWIWY